MADDKIISFEEHRRKRMGAAFQEDIFSELFRKDLREQPDLVQWFLFHRRLNAYKLYLHCLFQDNHEQGWQNHNAAFVPLYSPDDLGGAVAKISEALKWAGRSFTVVDCAGKTLRQVAEELTGVPHRTETDGTDAIREMLLRENRVVVLSGLSGSKLGSRKVTIARWFIKVLDDAHFDHGKSKADLVFIDQASFLEKAWGQIGAYLELLPPP